MNLLPPEAERVIVRWCEARNIGQLSRVGPDGFSKPTREHGGYADLGGWESDRVEGAIGLYRGGIWYPSRLRDLLDFVFWHGRALAEFPLLGPGQGLPEYVIRLGLRPDDLLKVALAKFGAILMEEIRRHPKPAPLKVFEGGVAPIGTEQDRSPISKKSGAGG